ncbi:hypothetical protein C8J57DRAFT_1301678, partial [Mycena rebaudengoi]
MLQALCSVPPWNRTPVAEILVEAKTAQAVIQAAFEVLKLLHSNSVLGLAMVAEVARAALSHSDFSDHELLGDLCVNCILNIMQDTNFPGNHGLMWEVEQVVETLAKVPFTEENSTSDLRTAIEFSIETTGFSFPVLLTQRTVMGQDMPMSELAQLLNHMVETRWLPSFDLTAAINDIRASR